LLFSIRTVSLVPAVVEALAQKILENSTVCCLQLFHLDLKYGEV
jgi:hypothetical protein